MKTMEAEFEALFLFREVEDGRLASEGILGDKVMILCVSVCVASVRACVCVVDLGSSRWEMVWDGSIWVLLDEMDLVSTVVFALGSTPTESTVSSIAHACLHGFQALLDR